MGPVYFPPAYSPGGSFPPAYFPGGDFGSAPTPPPPALPANLLAAIHARFRADQALAALVPGGLHTGLAPEDTALPYAGIVPLGEPASFNTGLGYVRTSTFQLTVFADEIDPLDRAKEALMVAFSPRSPQLAWAGASPGTSILIEATPGRLEPADVRSPQGDPLHRQFLTLLVSSNRTLCAHLPRGRWPVPTADPASRAGGRRPPTPGAPRWRTATCKSPWAGTSSPA